MYAPLIRVWLRKYDVQDTDADDLVQEVLLAVSKNLIKFDRGVLVSMGGASIPTEMAKAYLELIPSKVAEIGKEQE